jgi:hypothetical protein
MAMAVYPEVPSQIAGNVDAIAFSRAGDPDVGKFEDAVVLKTFGEVSSDLGAALISGAVSLVTPPSS